MAMQITKAQVVWLVDFKRFLVVFKYSTKKDLIGFSHFLRDCEPTTKNKVLINATKIGSTGIVDLPRLSE
jgi:hypothetical protein